MMLTVKVPLAEEYDAHANWKVVVLELARAKAGTVLNLKPLLDPQHLATQAADLTLKFMKWRMMHDSKFKCRSLAVDQSAADWRWNTGVQRGASLAGMGHSKFYHCCR